MKKAAYILLVLLGASMAMNVLADEKNKDKEKKKVAPPVVPVYFGNTNITTGKIKLPLFDSLIQQGFTSHDSTGRVFIVKQFMFTYCERNLYEDAVGNPIILTDYLSEYTMDSKLNPTQLESIRRRAKAGDTLIIERIKLEAADSTKAGAFGDPLKLFLTR